MIKKLIPLVLVMLSSSAYAQVLNIPTVVHIVYNEPSQNMSDAEIYQLIDQINENLKGTSTNSIVSREIFDTLIADTEIKLCLANLTPDGQPTNSILRTQATLAPLFGDWLFPVGASPIWDSENYFNLWIASYGPESYEFMGGWTLLPGDPYFPVNEPTGCVINKDFTTSSTVFANLATHEIGHYFGLSHTFIEDGVDDTPCSTENIAPMIMCNSTDITINTCNDDFDFWNVNAPDMIENFMTYHLGCQKMFTKGQKAKMRQYIFVNYPQLINNHNVTCNTAQLSENSLLQKSFYPNPASGESIEFKSCQGVIRFISIDGRIIKECVLSQEIEKVNIHDISSGAYYIYSESGYLGKFIKSF